MNPQERVNVLNDVRDALSALGNKSLWELQRDDLGTRGFESAAELITRVLRFVREVATSAEFELLPDEDISEMERVIRRLSVKVSALEKFTPSIRSDVVKERDILISELEAAYGSSFRYFATRLAAITHLSSGADRVRDDLAMRRNEFSSMVKEAEVLLETVRHAAHATGVTVHAGVFGEAAETHDRAARRWLWGTLLMASITGAASLAAIATVFIYRAEYAKLTLALLAQLSSVSVWCGRMYRARRHNEVINRYRQYALRSFETFVNSSTDEQVRNAVLLQATHCIFSAQPTGYSEEPREAPVAQPQVVEIIRGLAKPG